MALMSSGQNGQSFAFNGYLPIKPAERTRALKNFERRALQENQSQTFIEAPYRNEKLFADMLSVLQPSVRVTVAVDITSPTQQIRTRTVAEWRKAPQVDMHKKPTIFILGK
jgi:16S rRNA (cytidine1402-2'-O)-methyltransferase